MTESLKIALAQMNFTVGHIWGNLEKIRGAWERGVEEGVHLVVTSELSLSGYPLEDLVLKSFFQESLEEAVNDFCSSLSVQGPGLLIGAPWRSEGRLYNVVLLLECGRVQVVQRKSVLPNYGVFDEKRWFIPGTSLAPIKVRGVSLGLLICEDMWFADTAKLLLQQGAEILIVLNSSPFDETKYDIRLEKATQRVSETGLPLIYVNQVGGQDELVFDGRSFILQNEGTLCTQAYAFQEDFLTTIWTRKNREGRWMCETSRIETVLSDCGLLYRALMLGLSDYLEKNHFPGILIGLSGGIDSALCATLAVDALGSERVVLVMMPSPYTSKESLEDASELAQILGCRYLTLSIEDPMTSFEQLLKPYIQNYDPTIVDITKQNIQSRIRGLLLMTLSNTYGYMVLATGNKSELSVGYATLYGDMCGGYALLKDVYKTQVYTLSRWRNRVFPRYAQGPRGTVIPQRILDKVPSAELKPHQTDQDTLPPYEQLDDILKCLIEQDLSLEEIAARGHPQEVVRFVWGLLDRAEYKRRQSPPGVKLTATSFGKERRYPIVNAFFNNF